MVKRKSIYFCHSCKKVTSDSNDLFSIEDNHKFHFCSDKCATAFFQKMVEYYGDEEKHLRKQLLLEEEPCLVLKNNRELADTVLHNPDEIYLEKNDLGEKIYVHIKKINYQEEDYFYWLIAFYAESGPSFVLLNSITKSLDLLKEYKTGEKITKSEVASKDQSKFQIPQDIIDLVELKKSELLSMILQNHLVTDIQMENYHLYHDFMQDTLEQADEVYRYKDHDLDELFVYIKACEQDGISFFYIVLALPHKMEELKKQQLILPIISFPTIDATLADLFKKGEKLSSKTMN